jgi:hypothetical protein
LCIDPDLQTIIEAPISTPAAPADGVRRKAGSYSPGLTARKDLGYAVSDHDPAMGLTRDSHRPRCASPLLLVLSAPEGSGLF